MLHHFAKFAISCYSCFTTSLTFIVICLLNSSGDLFINSIDFVHIVILKIHEEHVIDSVSEYWVLIIKE